LGKVLSTPNTEHEGNETETKNLQEEGTGGASRPSKSKRKRTRKRRKARKGEKGKTNSFEVVIIKRGGVFTGSKGEKSGAEIRGEVEEKVLLNHLRPKKVLTN